MPRLHIAACLAVPLLLSSLGAQAATITYNVRSFADQGNIFGVSSFDQEQQDTVLLDRTMSVITGAQEALQSSDASFYANAATGEIKFGANARSAKSEFDSSSYQNRAVATSELTLTETFTAIGSGEVTFTAAIDGTLFDLDGPGNGNSRIDAALGGFARFGRYAEDSFFRTTGLLGAGSNAVDELLSVTVFVPENQPVTLTLDLFAQADAQTNLGHRESAGKANFFNTAKLSFETTDGLQLFASDPTFLSGGEPDVGPAVVPLPASLPLLLGGVGCMTMMRRKRRKE